MGRITEAIAIINKKDMPTEHEYKHFYTHLSREEALRLRKVYRKNKLSECKEIKDLIKGALSNNMEAK